MGQRRYPGAAPFRKEQSKIFYGRDRDIQKMLTLIKVEKRVLLYSKSGLGKTSLLEAGIIPKLPENYIPISVRFYASSSEAVTPVGRIINALEKTLEKIDDLPETLLDHLENKSEIKSSLWAYFKKLQLAGLSKNSDGKQKIFLLVFDQFEELFSYSEAEIEALKNEIYELSQPHIPDRFMTQIARARRKNREIFNSEAIESLQESLNIKTVFAIRSDRLSLLNRLSDKIRDIQNIYYEIKALDESQSRDAVINPAKDDDPDFESKPYSFQQDAIDKIINELTDGGKQSIETTQLQIVCHRIEDIAIEKHKKQNGDTNVEIEVDDLPEFKNIFLNFYNDSIGKLPPKDHHNAKRLIEDELIRSKQRISLDENICKEYIGAVELKLLVDTHLLRAEQNSFGRFSFELSHDTLVEPILESQKKYLAEQEKIALKKKQEKELQELQAKREQERLENEKEMKRIKAEEERKDRERKRKLFWRNLIIGIISVSLVISIGLGWWGYINYCDATKKTYEAEKEKQNATEQLILFKNSQYEKYMTNGDSATSNANYELAIENYKSANDWIVTQERAIMPTADTNCSILLLGRKLMHNISALFSRKDNGDENLKISPVNDSVKVMAIQKAELIQHKIYVCDSLSAKFKTIHRLIGEGNNAHNNKLYSEALTYYKQAYNEDRNIPIGKDRFMEVKKEARRMYAKSIEDLKNIDNDDARRKKEKLLDQLEQIESMEL